MLVILSFTPFYIALAKADKSVSTFGYTENGTSNTNIENRVVGVWGQATDGNGTADYIMARFTAVAGYG
ncbi:unnamed protein product, partial [marine sediment metagenome]